jgi:hypothetical protein
MTVYVLKTEAIQNAVENLMQSSIHRMFPGYLCLQQQAGIYGQNDDLPFPYDDFFTRHFQVSGGTKPYLVPFAPSEDPTDEHLWVGQNISGTYAPSSLRADSPFTKVVEVQESGHNSRWKLQSTHWDLARHHLCGGQQVPVESLAAFLYRDYGFEIEDPSAITLLKAFTDDFGYTIGGKKFTTLYETGDTNIGSSSFENHD